MADFRPILTHYRPYLSEMCAELSLRSFGKKYTLRTVVCFCIESGYRAMFPEKEITTDRKQAFVDLDFEM